MTLNWRTASENELLGFNVYRSGAGRTVKVNSKLIFADATGTTRGSAYRLVDTHLRRGVSYTYRLQLVRLDGSHRWAGASALKTR